MYLQNICSVVLNAQTLVIYETVVGDFIILQSFVAPQGSIGDAPIPMDALGERFFTSSDSALPPEMGCEVASRKCTFVHRNLLNSRKMAAHG